MIKNENKCKEATKENSKKHVYIYIYIYIYMIMMNQIIGNGESNEERAMI